MTMLGKLHMGPMATYFVQMLPISNSNAHQYDCHPPKKRFWKAEDKIKAIMTLKLFTTVSDTKSLFNKCQLMRIRVLYNQH